MSRYCLCSNKTWSAAAMGLPHLLGDDIKTIFGHEEVSIRLIISLLNRGFYKFALKHLNGTRNGYLGTAGYPGMTQYPK